MLDLTEQSAVVQKIRELCQTILDEPDMVSARQRIDAFMADEQAQGQYRGLVSRGQALQEKQQQAVPLSDAEIADFQSQRDQVMGNPIARGFLEAQEQMQSVHHSVTKYLSMTLETGQVPTPEDFEHATCGHGCNCSH